MPIPGIMGHMPFVSYVSPPGGGTAFLGAKTGGHTAATTQTISLTDLKDADNNSITLQENDIVVVSMSRTSTVGNLASSTISPSTAGYVLVTDLFLDNSWDCNFAVNYKIMGASPDSSVDLPGTGGGGMAWTIFAFRGIDTSSPLDVAAVTATGSGTRFPDPGAITPATAGAIISVHAGGSGSDGSAGWEYTNPGDLSTATNHFLSTSQDGSGAGGSFAGTGVKLDWTSGAFDPATWTGTGGSDTNNGYGVVTIAWRPA